MVDHVCVNTLPSYFFPITDKLQKMICLCLHIRIGKLDHQFFTHNPTILKNLPTKKKETAQGQKKPNQNKPQKHYKSNKN